MTPTTPDVPWEAPYGPVTVNMYALAAARHMHDWGTTSEQLAWIKVAAAAHAQHVRYGLSLMNRWATEGGNPFADARWDEAWRTSSVDAAAWSEIRAGLRSECDRWLGALAQERPLNFVATAGLMGSIAHLAYHLGAIRQIAARTRGPREGTFV